MRKLLTLFFAVIILVGIVGCARLGKTDGAVIDYGSSEKFSQEEIQAAVDIVLKEFKTFKGCELKKLWYDEEASNRCIESDLSSDNGGNVIKDNGVQEENAIYLFSDFYVTPSAENAENSAWNTDFTYTNWRWILARDNKNEVWKVIADGEG